MSQVNGQVRRGRTPGAGGGGSEPVLNPGVFSSAQAVLSALLPLLERLLEQSGPDTPDLLRSEAQLALLVLGKYNQASAPLLAQDQNCLDLFVRALRSSTQWHPDVPSCQIQALEQVSPT